MTKLVSWDPSARTTDFVALEAAERLDAELQRITICLRAASAADLSNARAAIRRAIRAARDLREHALGATTRDPLDVRADSLRARAVVAALQLSQLERAARGVGFAELPADTFASVDAFREHVLGCVGRLNAHWCAEYKLLPKYAAAAFAVVEAAETTFATIGRDPRVERFLAWGIACGSNEMRSACRVLSVALGLSIDREEVTGVEVPSLPTLLAHLAAIRDDGEEE